jgi:SAM-dependent methyltransferase
MSSDATPSALPSKQGHSSEQPSEWIVRWARSILPHGAVLDLACGSGRHSRFLAARGFQVCAVDRDRQALSALAGVAGVTRRWADLEIGSWPLQDLKFDGVVVTHYLHRPLFPAILDLLAPAGVLIYETFAAGNERFGKPSNPDFLLRRGELLEVTRCRLRILAFEDVELTSPRPARIQRICASAPSAEL